MDRRAFMGVLTGGLLAVPLAAEAQTGKVARMGWLALTEVPNAPGRLAFRDGLRELGWVEGRNLVIEVRSAGGKRELLSGLAAELVRLNVDVLVGAATLEAQALMQATKTIPIVFAASSDPVEAGLVDWAALAGTSRDHRSRSKRGSAGSGWSCSKRRSRKPRVSRCW